MTIRLLAAKFGVMAACLFLLFDQAQAQVKLHRLFSDHTVLQRDKDIPVYGTAAPGEKVEVTFQDKTASTEADANGRWKVNLGKFSAGGPYEMTVKGTNTIAVTDILVGEVWISSGQSNAAWGVQGCTNASQEIADGEYPQIRTFNLPTGWTLKPQSDISHGGWSVCEKGGAAKFCAIGYFFAREIHKRLKVPIGIINTSMGATPAESWTSAQGLDVPALAHYLRQHENTCKTMEGIFKAYFAQLDKWKEQSLLAIQDGRQVTPVPRSPMESAATGSGTKEPVVLFNSMVAPLVGYPIRGAIWYQGEGNAQRAVEYRTLFPAMIQDWRNHWGDEFPFLWIQLSSYSDPAKTVRNSDWALLREAQTMTLKLPATGQAVTFDVGDGDIHPRNKQDMGYRLALIAMSKVYGQDVVWSGPMYKEMKMEGDRIRLSFNHLGGGLTATPGQTLIPREKVPDDTPLAGSELKRFEIAGEDKQFVWANAKIDGDTVVVWNEKVGSPVAVRYAWSENPLGANLYNQAGLPASPFRTDKWDYSQPNK